MNLATIRGEAGGRIEGAALVALGLLGMAALVHPARPLAMAILVGMFLILRTRDPAAARIVAAALPVSVALSWGASAAPISLPGDCVDPFAPVAMWRLYEMLAVVGTLGALIGLGQFDRKVVPFVRPAPVLVGALAIAAGVVAGASLLAGPAAAGPFFGSFVLELAPLAIVPALVFAVSNAIAEEVAYRGVLRVGLAPALGALGANVAQAAIFALAHSGPDFVGSPLPVMASMFAGALLAGAIAARTRSLLVPIALHAAFDLPIFFYWACRLG